MGGPDDEAYGGEAGGEEEGEEILAGDGSDYREEDDHGRGCAASSSTAHLEAAAVLSRLRSVFPLSSG